MNRLNLVVVCMVIFGTVGPLVGAACFFMSVMNQTDPASSIVSWDLLDSGMLLVYTFLIFGAYLLGGIPALATGCVFGMAFFRWRVGHMSGMLLGAISGAIVSAIGLLVLSAVKGLPFEFPSALIAPAIVPGAVCGLICSFVSARRGPPPVPPPSVS